ncbi:MAG TPA: hypothetical protein VFZ95_07755, partial [Steroidobacteraceae bacterium]
MFLGGAMALDSRSKNIIVVGVFALGAVALAAFAGWYWLAHRPGAKHYVELTAVDSFPRRFGDHLPASLRVQRCEGTRANCGGQPYEVLCEAAIAPGDFHLLIEGREFASSPARGSVHDLIGWSPAREFAVVETFWRSEGPGDGVELFVGQAHDQFVVRE